MTKYTAQVELKWKQEYGMYKGGHHQLLIYLGSICVGGYSLYPKTDSDAQWELWSKGNKLFTGTLEDAKREAIARAIKHYALKETPDAR